MPGRNRSSPRWQRQCLRTSSRHALNRPSWSSPAGSKTRRICWMVLEVVGLAFRMKPDPLAAVDELQLLLPVRLTATLGTSCAVKAFKRPLKRDIATSPVWRWFLVFLSRNIEVAVAF